MRLVQFNILRLFGLYDHVIGFPNPDTQSPKASVIMLYGHNGIGKTTVLRMIDGMMGLNFTIFRRTKFDLCSLEFSNKKKLQVRRVGSANELTYLEVEYGGFKVKLDPKEQGPLRDGVAELKEEQENQENLRKHYKEDLVGFSFEFIDTERLFKHTVKLELDRSNRNSNVQYIEYKTDYKRKLNKNDPAEYRLLSERVRDFITQSQLHSSQYFSGQTALFDKIISSIDDLSQSPLDGGELITRLNTLSSIDEKFEMKRLGLVMDKWDKKKLYDYINNAMKKPKDTQSQILAVISSYLEFLESRQKERQLLASRLLTFEDAINKLFQDKDIRVSAEKGFVITSATEDSIDEFQLSTGEFHLLYLSVLALTTKLIGTVIAIDEPEMSMHVKWQRNLVNVLSKCASNANPLFIFATHSPEIAANYENSLQTRRYSAPDSRSDS